MLNERGIEFSGFDFNKYMKTDGELRNQIKKFIDIADACVIKDGIIIQNQTKIFRVNCASCLDRTSVFMSILFEYVLMKFSDSNEFNYELHTALWHERANIISLEYAGTPGQKIYMMSTGNQPKIGSYYDKCISITRSLSSICREGKLTDSFNAVLQEKKFSTFHPISHVWRLLLFIYLLFVYIFFLAFKGKTAAYFTWKNRIKTIIDHPHFDDLRDADEFHKDMHIESTK